MTDRIHVIEARMKCRIGVPAEERRVPQDVIVDLTLEKDLRTAAYSECVTDTIDYAEVLTVLRDVAASREWVLIESLAERMCEAVLERFPAESVRVLLRKPAALREQGAAAAAVEMERRR